MGYLSQERKNKYQTLAQYGIIKYNIVENNI